MPCRINMGSCSLCPYCGTETCPHFHDHDNDKRYWIYILDRRNSCYDLLFNVNTKKEIKNIINNLKEGKYNSKFNKKHQYCFDLTKNKTYYLPLIEITITDGEISWDTSIRLLYNIKTKELNYYDGINSDITYSGSFTIIKSWDNKINFIKLYFS